MCIRAIFSAWCINNSIIPQKTFLFLLCEFACCATWLFPQQLRPIGQTQSSRVGVEKRGEVVDIPQGFLTVLCCGAAAAERLDGGVADAVCGEVRKGGAGRRVQI